MKKGALQSVTRIIKRILKLEEYYVAKLSDGRFAISDGMVLWAFPMSVVAAPYNTMVPGVYRFGEIDSGNEKDIEGFIPKEAPPCPVWPVLWNGLAVLAVDPDGDDMMLFWVEGEITAIRRAYLKEAAGILDEWPHYKLRSEGLDRPVLISWSPEDPGVTGIIMPRKVTGTEGFSPAPDECPKGARKEEGRNESPEKADE